MTEGKIEILETGIRVVDLEVRRRDVADYLHTVAPDDRELALVRAVEVGAFCLQRAGACQDMEFVRRQVEGLMARVERDLAAIPPALQRELLATLGTRDGQVLAPVQRLVEDASRATAERLREVRGLFAEELDPEREASTLGRALRDLRALLDPRRTDSVQGCFASAVGVVAEPDGPLARSVRSAVSDAIRPLAHEVDRLGRQLCGAEAAAEALLDTPRKGASYEAEVVETLQRWLGSVGGQIHHVGTDNRPGDIVIRFAAASLAGADMALVIEVRDRRAALGRKVVAETLHTAMAARHADAGIYLSRSPEGFAREIGEWAEGECGHGPWVATTSQHLHTAVRLLLVQHRLAALRASRPSVDTRAVEAQTQRVRTALGRITVINRKITDIRACTGEIQLEAEALRDDVRAALVAIEDAMRTVSGENGALATGTETGARPGNGAVPSSLARNYPGDSA